MSRPLHLLRRLPTRRVILSQSGPLLPKSSILHLSRQVSTSAVEAKSLVTRLKNLLYGTSISLFAIFTYLYVTDTRASVHQWLAVPSLRWLYPDAEDAHHVGTQSLKALYSFGLHPRERLSKSQGDKNADLSVLVFGQKLQNPIGTSAGIDKLAEIPDALFALGPAIVEVGGATPYPQNGNAKPRVFRLPSQKGLINRYGLNSLGAEDMAMRLRERVRMFAYHNGFGIGQEAEDLVLNGGAGVPPGSLIDGKMLIVQVAKNKWTKDEDIEAVIDDFVRVTTEVAKFSDIISVNVSSPNTPGLRTLQRVEPLTKILEGVVGAARSIERNTKPKVMVKVSPDEDDDKQIEGIVEAVWRSGVDGIIVGNTTKRRANLISTDTNISTKERQILEEQGGYSGPQMFERTLGLVKRYRQLLDQGPQEKQDISNPVSDPTLGDEPAGDTIHKIELTKDSSSSTITGAREPKVIFATGGITNGKQALEVLNAGASVAQVYTAVIYGGVGTISNIKREMQDNIASIKLELELVK